MDDEKLRDAGAYGWLNEWDWTNSQIGCLTVLITLLLWGRLLPARLRCGSDLRSCRRVFPFRSVFRGPTRPRSTCRRETRTDRSRASFRAGTLPCRRTRRSMRSTRGRAFLPPPSVRRSCWCPEKPPLLLREGQRTSGLCSRCTFGRRRTRFLTCVRGSSRWGWCGTLTRRWGCWGQSCPSRGWSPAWFLQNCIVRQCWWFYPALQPFPLWTTPRTWFFPGRARPFPDLRGFYRSVRGRGSSRERRELLFRRDSRPGSTLPRSTCRSTCASSFCASPGPLWTLGCVRSTCGLPEVAESGLDAFVAGPVVNVVLVVGDRDHDVRLQFGDDVPLDRLVRAALCSHPTDLSLNYCTTSSLNITLLSIKSTNQTDQSNRPIKRQINWISQIDQPNHIKQIYQSNQSNR